MRKARVGVIGTGWWSTQAHIPSLKGYEKVDLVGLADPNPANLAKAAEYYEVDRTYEDYRHLLSDAKVEGVVMVIHAGKTPRDVIRKARDNLRDVGAKILGTVINRVDIEGSRYYYYYYHQDYYGYGHYGTDT